MKTKNLLIAALLLGGMTAFNSCSEKEIDSITPPVDQPVAEELETVLSLNVGLGNSAMTKADSKKYNSFEVIRNYGEAVFAVGNDGKPGKLLAFYGKTNGTKAIFAATPDAYDESNESNYSDQGAVSYDPWGFYLQPLKFKVDASTTRVAIVVVANCDQLFKGVEQIDQTTEVASLPGTITDFDSFQKYANTVTLPLIKSDKFKGYPMSSNVLYAKITPGANNSIGFGQDSDGNNEYAKSLEYYKLTNLGTGRVISEDKRILLYRCWSQIKLDKLTVAPYSVGATEAKFELEEVFVMNVPTKTNLFNIEENKSWTSWGGELNILIQDLIGLNSNDRPSFYSGYLKDMDGDKEYSTGKFGPGKAYDKGFRSQEIAKVSGFYLNYNRPLSEIKKEVVLNYPGNVSEEFSKSDYNWNGNVVAKPIAGENNYLTFIVSPSIYGLNNSEQAVVLVVKGKYSQKIGGVWVGTGESETDEEGNVKTEITSSYYTVFVNESGTITGNADGLLGKNIEGSIMRNVQYEIDLTVKGPGSYTPVLHTATTYMVPKVSIVPFGIVRQIADID